MLLVLNTPRLVKSAVERREREGNVAQVPLIAGNWKMNGGGADGLALAADIKARVTELEGRCDLLICPPAVLIAAVAKKVAGTLIAVVAQDCHAQVSGAHTGYITASMLKEAGARYVISGHSERRTDHGETDSQVRDKAAAVHAAGLIDIICIGETEAERDGGHTLEVLSRQIAGSIPSDASAANTVIAYEPVWAIGTARTPAAAEVAEAHAHIRAELGGKVANWEAARILYGGSVKPENAAELLHIDNVNGALVGGASLECGSFLTIAQAAA